MVLYLAFRFAALSQRKVDKGFYGADLTLNARLSVAADNRGSIYIIILVNLKQQKKSTVQVPKKKNHRNGCISPSIEQANTSSKQPLPSRKEACHTGMPKIGPERKQVL